MLSAPFKVAHVAEIATCKEISAATKSLSSDFCFANHPDLQTGKQLTGVLGNVVHVTFLSYNNQSYWVVVELHILLPLFSVVVKCFDADVTLLSPPIYIC